MTHRARSLLFYATFILLGCVGIVYGNAIRAAQPDLRVWEWTTAAWLLIGLPFILLQGKAGLPEAWDSRHSARDRLLWPLLIGMLFGAADLIIIEHLLPHLPHTRLPPYTQPFPYSLILYGSGGFEVEVFYRLIPITLAMWGLGYCTDIRHRDAGFFVVAILTSLVEPLEQWPSGPTWFVSYALVSGFAMNLLQAFLLRRHGFSAPVSTRMGHYMVWHILNGVLIEYTLP